ncbi:PREDICTED: alpha-1-acid glycoprotein 1-like isoform X1 [Crocodylus porosus]|uniref:alpha-1-acid glycoprotein 1-like isoform X1 n=1 Tax=Crocodylus porosus TaxID=8502 RepID=UPI00093AA750|nr:PREDICTED: alpha-1-acid glycoprotein 1-like isoform X1 [Crocodylus porosus]
MVLGCIVAVLNLLPLLCANPLHCDFRVPQIPDNTTGSKLLGKWFYVAGASQFPLHWLEMTLIDNGYLQVDPNEQGQELLINQHVSAMDECLTNNSTYFEVTVDNAILIKNVQNRRTMGKLMNSSSEDILLIQFEMQKEKNYTGLYLYARNQPPSKVHLNELRDHAECLGLSEEKIVYAPWKKVKFSSGIPKSHCPVCSVLKHQNTLQLGENKKLQSILLKMSQ